MDFAIFEGSFHLLKDSPKVVALVNIIALESITIQILHKILSRISVITYLQRKDFKIFHQAHKPVIAIMIINKIISAQFQKTALDVNVVRDAISCNGFVQLFSRKPELGKNIKLLLPLDNNDCCREVGCL